jgi:hypothetical protein
MASRRRSSTAGRCCNQPQPGRFGDADVWQSWAQSGVALLPAGGGALSGALCSRAPQPVAAPEQPLRPDHYMIRAEGERLDRGLLHPSPPAASAEASAATCCRPPPLHAAPPVAPPLQVCLLLLLRSCCCCPITAAEGANDIVNDILHVCQGVAAGRGGGSM